MNTCQRLYQPPTSPMALSLAIAPPTIAICAGERIVCPNIFSSKCTKPKPQHAILATAPSSCPCAINAVPAVISPRGILAGRRSMSTTGLKVSISNPKMSPKSNCGQLENLHILHSGCIVAMLDNGGPDDGAWAKSGDYSGSMQQSMGTSLTYRHDLGMNYNHIVPDLIVGSCPQTPADIDRLKVAGVGTIFCLQQDPDLAYFSVDIDAIQKRARELNVIEHIRAPIRDFDPYDLRLRLPKVMAVLFKAIERNAGTKTYIHCTAGLGRAPAVALTYMYWIRGYELAEANLLLQSVRHCHPKLDSIKGATADILAGNPTKAVLLSWKGNADYRVEVAGLDVGWYERIPLQRVEEGHWCVERDVPVGEYEFKFIVDGDWKLSQDYAWSSPTKGKQMNNVINVSGDSGDAPLWEFRKQIMADGFVLTDEHRSVIKERLEVLGEG